METIQITWNMEISKNLSFQYPKTNASETGKYTKKTTSTGNVEDASFFSQGRLKTHH